MSIFSDSKHIVPKQEYTREMLSTQQEVQAKKLFGDTLRLFKEGNKYSIMMCDEVINAIRQQAIEVVLKEQQAYKF